MTNPSANGYAEEKRIAEMIIKHSNKEQIIGFRKYKIDSESVCTNLKLEVGGHQLTENDINF